ncbi:tripartite tricarboxylate transporter TctB family protein [Pseudochelatococcus sp. B33]
MYRRDYRDIVGGAALVIIGGFTVFHAFTSLRLGSMVNMGPGMFPAVLGVVLVIFGFILMIPAWFRAGTGREVDFRSLASVVASILAFGLLMRPLGMIPAITALTLIASRADSKLSLGGVLILAATLSVGAYLIFSVGLRMPIVIFAWPW